MSTTGAPVPPYHPQEHPSHIRSTDAQRDEVAAMVRAAAGDGRLDLVELDDRLGHVYAAKTHGDLAKIVADIVPMRPAPPAPVRPAPLPDRAPDTSPRTIMPGFLLCLFLGVFGAHRFYVGKNGSGAAMIVLAICTFGVASGVWAFIDLIVLATGSFRDEQGRTLRDWT
ncbi:DUF1707 domain-containing protein [Phytoactinopolyspora alkaliphila]